MCSEMVVVKFKMRSVALVAARDCDYEQHRHTRTKELADVFLRWLWPLCF